ncbi:EAL domain-containing protein [Wenzhouxiangella sp. AB-CW3]|uniref:EAL domain-containing protein n=1 Tax=Wenzhouxiangella sp. AB-CW3 TaxID=2771012 RepID=UPI00168BE32C|nr:EAL domain-containing protein [Wenzhouxiangella sp. AB-CW3]QOC21908.1 EAL domain-containing protein [Wenzhouxiangella sp. AB-CW3]
MASPLAQTISLSATGDHCAFAAQRIQALQADGAVFGADWPWYELLIRPDSACFNGSPAGFVECLYLHRPPSVTDVEVLERAGYWLAERAGPTRISVNAHPESFIAPYFVDTVTRMHKLLGEQGHSLCLELIEFADCSNRSRLIEHARLLRQRGVLIALDDFGSRMNCFDLCAAGVVDIVKIDGRVISGFDSRSHQRAVVDCLTTLADRLGGVVVAEGVERPQELQLLKDLGVGYAQGYLVHEPEIMEI